MPNNSVSEEEHRTVAKLMHENCNWFETRYRVPPHIQKNSSGRAHVGAGTDWVGTI